MTNSADLASLPEIRAPDIDRCIQKYVYEKTISAAACIASVGGRVFHRAVYGSPTPPPPRRRIGHDTLFDLSGLTMPLASGLGALHLASRSRIDLGAPLSKTIPELKAGVFGGIKIDMLLDHTAGLVATRRFYEEIAEHDARAPKGEKLMGTPGAADFMKKRAAEIRLESEPGSKAVISDLGFLVLGWILEGLVARPLDVFLAREVYGPLGLADDLFFVRRDDFRQQARLRRRIFAATEECPWRHKLLQGETRDGNAWALGGVAGHAGLFGTADAVWRLVFHLWGGHTGEDRTFLSGTVRRFWTRSKRIRRTTRALAWDTPDASKPPCGKRYSRTSVGFTDPAGLAVWVDLSTDVIGVILTNAAHPTLEGKEEVLDRFLPRVFELIAKEGESLPPDPKKATGAAAFYDGPLHSGIGLPLANPLKGPGKP